jgi:hypothetical protein
MLVRPISSVLKMRNLSGKLSILRRAAVECTPEIASHVALIAVSRVRGDVSKRQPGVMKHPASALDTKRTCILANRASVTGSKRPGDVDRMQSESPGKIGQ